MSSNKSSSSNDPKKSKQEVNSKSKGKVGEWVRHTSSSGKEYYFNVNSHASQWEKPGVWLEHEQKYGPVPNQPTTTPKPAPTKPSQQTTSIVQSSQQQDAHHQGQQQSRDRYLQSFPQFSASSSAGTSNNSFHGHGNSYGGQSSTTHYSHSFPSTSGTRQEAGALHSVSSSVSSTERGDHGNSFAGLSRQFSAAAGPGMRDSRKPSDNLILKSENLQSEDMDISPLEDESPPDVKLFAASTPNTPGPSSAMRDPRGDRDREDRDSYSSRNNGYHGRDRDRDRLRDRDRDARDSPRRDRDRDRDRGRGRDRDRDKGRDPRDRSRSKLRDERSRSPWDRDGTPERHGSDSTTGLIVEIKKEQEIPDLPASLAVHFREDLIGHTKNLPGEPCERQANKIMDELLTTNAVQLSKVSAELKMARSLVRLTDIQSTLKEQRILFLREQIQALEESDRDSSSFLGIDAGEQHAS